MTDIESLPSFTISSIREGLTSKAFTATELAKAALAFAEKENAATNAYLTFSPERALKAAAKLDAQIAKGEYAGAMAGVPVAIKDVIITKDLRTTCGSKILAQYIPPYDATAVFRLEAEGAVIIGKTNCDEFAMGSSNENSAFGPVHNPKALDRVPGGSSGGSAAAVSQGTAVAALGSDTGGSIRQPASFCGVVGVTPTYGRVSRYGLVAFASSLDHIGPLARNVEDAATVLQTIAGRDDFDSTSAFAPVDDYRALMKHPVNGLKLGLAKEYFEGLGAETGDVVRAAIKQLQSLGCELREISLPHTKYALSCYYIIATAEASSNLARYDGVRYTTRNDGETLSEMYRNTRGCGFGAEVKRRIMLGTYVLSAGYYEAYYRKAQQVRALITRDFSNAFEEVDAIVAPVSPIPAFKIGEKIDDPLAMYLSDVYTLTGDLSGVPCMSVPCGESDGLPIGLQIFTKHFDEATMFRIAYNFEQSRAN
ncbi:MAG: Asp-tRNA(Asn)/Glu-tRNA(Gln) amidotransferase subunit GatA [Acidobacteriaceae bacterium]|nr:Asp-tRNA(Asn)/Glu-tRNA(Gln) amidotransferase subunit GatA [Acidobacteriaceae bacterium]MBV9779694.1 Asp-tRNA(Asn)/Glu-tRNA(Gln) amidotransferase subunit GatA [Acidobacteriaceae bacterium]